MAEGKDKFDINNDQKLKQDNLDKSDGPIAKTEMHEGYDHEQYNKLDRDQIEALKQDNLDKSDGPGPDGPMEIVHLEDDAIQVSGDVAGGDAENYNAGTNWVKTDTPIHDTEERADTDIIPGDVPKVELNQGLGDYVKDGDNLSSDHIAKTEILDGQPEQGILAQANGAPNVSGDVVNMADMHSHMDDAAEHQVPEGPPQNPQGMGLDRLGTQFDEDGMGDMHKPDDPNDGGELV